MFSLVQLNKTCTVHKILFWLNIITTPWMIFDPGGVGEEGGEEVTLRWQSRVVLEVELGKQAVFLDVVGPQAFSREGEERG